MVFVRPGFLLVLQMVVAKRAFRREDLPTLERPRKATSGTEVKGMVRKREAEKRRVGGWEWKKLCA